MDWNKEGGFKFSVSCKPINSGKGDILKIVFFRQWVAFKINYLLVWKVDREKKQWKQLGRGMKCIVLDINGFNVF